MQAKTSNGAMWVVKPQIKRTARDEPRAEMKIDMRRSKRSER